MGKASRYETLVKPFLQEIPKWYRDMTERQIAKKLGIAVSTWEQYKTQHEELRACLKGGREELIYELKDALRQKAKGFHYKETKRTIRDVDGKKTQLVEEYDRYSPPDVGAIHLLLKNLDENWHNDDAATMALKREQLELSKQKAEEW